MRETEIYARVRSAREGWGRTSRDGTSKTEMRKDECGKGLKF